MLSFFLLKFSKNTVDLVYQIVIIELWTDLVLEKF